MIHETIAAIVDGRHLSREDAAEVMLRLMQGEATSAQIGALLVALRMKGETVEEITGFAESMRALATRITTSRRPLVDTCGTGGDRSNTFNISTTAAFVVAGAGVAVAKHGNRSASSLCGSADVLEALGVQIDATPETVGKCIDQVGIGFLFARSLHSAMKHVAPVRQELKMRTVFNVLGPLTNPAGADGQVVGVFDTELTRPLAEVLANLGSRHVFVVAARDGLDELSLEGPTVIAEALNGTIHTYELTAADVGLERAPRSALQGGKPDYNASALRKVLEGAPGPHRDVVLFNAAAGILAGGDSSNWKAAIESARASIDSGAALSKLEELIKASHDS